MSEEFQVPANNKSHKRLVETGDRGSEGQRKGRASTGQGSLGGPWAGRPQVWPFFARGLVQLQSLLLRPKDKRSRFTAGNRGSVFSFFCLGSQLQARGYTPVCGEEQGLSAGSLNSRKLERSAYRTKLLPKGCPEAPADSGDFSKQPRVARLKSSDNGTCHLGHTRSK